MTTISREDQAKLDALAERMTAKAAEFGIKNYELPAGIAMTLIEGAKYFGESLDYMIRHFEAIMVPRLSARARNDAPLN